MNNEESTEEVAELLTDMLLKTVYAFVLAEISVDTFIDCARHSYDRIVASHAN